jgi:PAS domain S-box-containing protein
MDNLKILLIDDNPDDRELIMRELNRSFPDVKISQAIDNETFEKELTKVNFNLVITDYQLKWSNGIEILKRIKNIDPFIPVIMFTGTGNEEIAVEAMKLGLDDYVIKSPKHFKRLPFSVSLTLDNIEQRKKKLIAEQKYKDLFEHVPIGIIDFMPDGSILEINTYAADMLGFAKDEKKIQLNIKDIFYQSDDYERFIASLEDQAEISNFETQLKNKNGKIIWAKIDAKYLKTCKPHLHIEATIKDITFEKMLISQLIQSQKLEAIGHLLLGIAHDFNNVLTPIMGYTDMLLLNPHIKDTAKEYIKSISKMAETAASLSKQLVIYSKSKQYQPEILNLNFILNELKYMLQKLVGEDINIEMELSHNLHLLYADKSQIQQIIMNLAINAKDAMPKGGSLFIKAENIQLKKNDPSLPSDAKAGNYILLTIRDTGVGIDSETIRYIFERFFSSKPEQKGTGLGLSIVYNIIKQCNGWITVESELNKGTCFKIYLPAYKGKSKPKPIQYPEKVNYDKLVGNQETILILEDANEIRNYMKIILEKNNYKVYEASTYEEALKIFKTTTEPINVLLCDLKLPDKNGIDAAKEFSEMAQGIKIIISTAYINKDNEINEISKKGWRFLQKPYTSVTLLKTIKEVIKK